MTKDEAIEFVADLISSAISTAEAATCPDWDDNGLRSDEKEKLRQALRVIATPEYSQELADAVAMTRRY